MSLFDEQQQIGSFPRPREFQIKAMHSIAGNILAGHKNQMLMAPTGAGKTYLGLRLIYKALKAGKRATFLCDRITLVNQTSEAANEFGLGDHGIIQADHPMENWAKRFQIASVQSVESRGWPDTDVLIVDEAHTMRDAWVKYAMESHAKVIGLSATPFSRGLGKVFTELVCPTTMHELTQLGELVPMRVLSCRRPDMSGAKVDNFGEWQQGEAAARGMEIIGDVVAEWLRHGEGRKTIVFGATIAHCEELCRQFNEAGVQAATFTKDTLGPERKQLVDEFKRPDSVLRVLISVEALAKGFDVKDVGCVVDCRPLRKSLSTAIQMWGRGLRKSEATGKKDCILLDHSGNITRFADDFTDIYFNGLATLDKGEALDKTVRKDEQDEREKKGCPECGYKPFRKRCMSCGFEILARSEIVHEAGTMHPVTIGGKQMERADLFNELCAYARSRPGIQKKASFAKAKFKELTGDWPPCRWSFDHAPDVPVSEALGKKLEGQFKNRLIRARYQRDKEAAAA